MLVQQDPESQKILKVGLQVLEIRGIVEKYWSKLQKIISNKPDTSIEYAKYLDEIVWDSQLSLSIMERAKEYTQMQSVSQRVQNNSDSNDNSENPIIKIQVDNFIIGKIVDVNQALCSAFGFFREELVGHSLNWLIPKCLKSLHNQILEENVKIIGEKERITSEISKVIPAITKMNYLIVCKKTIIKFPNLIEGPFYVAKLNIDISNHSPDITFFLTSNVFEIYNTSSSIVPNC